MKLVYTATAYPPNIGGAQLHQHMLAQEMLRRKHSVNIISHWDVHRSDWLLGTTLQAPSFCKDYAIDGVSVHQLGLSRKEKISLIPSVLGYYPAMNIALPKISKVLQPHLRKYTRSASLIHNVRIGREGLTHASLQIARKQNIPFVLTPVHHPRWTGWRYRAYLSLYKAADAVMALTSAERDILMALGVKKKRIHVIGHGPILSKESNGEDFLKKHEIDGPAVLFLGQHYVYKGYKQLLEATRIVWQKNADVHFVFIGPSVKNSEIEFQSYSDRRIHRLGKVSLQEKTDALASCSLLCVPSTQESFGGVYVEAWAFKKPVIGCNILSVADVIDDGINGLLSNQNASEISEHIISLIENPSEAQKLGAAGREKLDKCFSWSTIAQRLEWAYENTL